MVTLTLSSNGVGADISTVNIPFGQISTAYNNHVGGLADLHDSTQIGDAALLESTTIVNAASTVHARLDMIYAMLSGILGGSGNASTRYAARSTDLTSLAATVAGASATGASLTIPRRDSNGGVTFGVGALAGSGILGVVNTTVGVVPLYIINASGQTAVSILVRDSTNTITRFSVDATGNTFVGGTLTAGSGSVAVTDASGHVLSAALNTVSPTQGGTGVSNPSAGYVKAAGGATAMATVATIPVGDGGTGQTSYTNGQLLIGNTTGGTLAKGTITGSGGIVVTNGAGTIALSASGLAASGANGDITSLTGLTTPLSPAQGGTGSGTYTDGQLNIGNSTGNTLTKGAITASGGIVVTNGHGTIALSTSGLAASGINGDITSLTGLTTPLSVAQGGTGGNSQAAAQAALGVPSTTGVGASGSWPITVGDLSAGSILGVVKGGTGVSTLAAGGLLIGHGTAAVTALTTTTDGAIPQWSVASGSWVAGSLGNATIGPGQITQDKLAPLYYAAGGTALTVVVNGGTLWNGNSFLDFAGGTSPALTNTGSIGVGNKRMDMLYIDATGNLLWANGSSVLAANLAPFPALPAQAIPVVFLMSYSGTTAIVVTNTGSNSYFYRDGRSFFLNPTGVGPTGNSYGTTISDYKPGTNGAAGTISIGAGGAYEDSGGSLVGPLNAQTVTMPAQPSGTNVQYIGISLGPTTGSPVATPGAVAASIGVAVPPALPLTNRSVAMVIWRGATTLPTGVIAAADIIDLRGGAGSGGGGAPVSAAYGVYGVPPASLSGAFNLGDPAASAFVHAKLSKTAITDASVYDTFSTSVTNNIVGSAAAGSAASGLRLVIGTNAPPIVVALPGVTREIVATTDVQGNAPTASVAAKYQVVGDLRGTGPAFIPTLTTAGATLFPSETVLFTIWWTGFAWDFNSLFYPAFPLLNSGHFSLVRIPHQAYAGTNSNVGTGGAAAVMVGSSPYTVMIPAEGMRGEVTFTGDWQQSAGTITGVFALLFVDGVWFNSISLQNLQTVAGGQYYPFIFHVEVAGLAAGAHTFQPGYLNTAAVGTFGVPIQNLRMWGTFSRS